MYSTCYSCDLAGQIEGFHNMLVFGLRENHSGRVMSSSLVSNTICILLLYGTYGGWNEELHLK